MYSLHPECKPAVYVTPEKGHCHDTSKQPVVEVAEQIPWRELCHRVTACTNPHQSHFVQFDLRLPNTVDLELVIFADF